MASMDLPYPYGKLFQRYEAFNELQSSLLEDLLHSDKSVVLSAPTGSGKTVAFELAIVRMLQVAAMQLQQLPRMLAPKAIYVAPIKALCAEKFLDWKTRFEALPVQVVQITGDSDVTDLTVLRGAAAPPQLVITTPEKWDSLTRRWRECDDVMSTVRLFMVDEVHLLNEDVRGPILEAIVSRMKTIASSVANLQCGEEMDSSVTLRFVVASATIPNIEDLCLWLSKSSGSSDVAQFAFTDMQRPVPLEKHILGFSSKLKGFQFDISMNYKLPEVLRKYSERKPTLIFCNSRKSAEMATAALSREATKIFPLSDNQKMYLTQLAARLHDNKLRKVLAHGIAFHHAGMTYEDRSLIEDSFRKGFLMVLLSTNTLAMGVNLPAHLVVIKSTESYCRGSLEEYTESTLLQMIGRAGRPQYDTRGIAVILTHNRNVHKYENMMHGKMPIESHLHKHLAEHLNVEIALGTIHNMEVAMNWMRSTYLYVRCVRNPANYGLEAHMDKDFVEKKLQEMCLVQINALHTANLITMTTTNGIELQTTPYGKLMAKYYLCFETMKIFRQVRGSETLLEMLNIIVRCKEFSEITVRVNEKKTLNELSSSPIRFPIQGRVKTREDKISCLIQAVLGNLPISSPGLAQESLKILRIGDRVAKCLLEYLRLSEHQLKAFPSGCYKALLHAVTIAKSFHAKLWENSEFASKQLRKIGAVYSSLLANAGKSTLKSIAETDARTIELIVNKTPPFGDEVLQHLLSFPEFALQVNLKSTDMLQIRVQQMNEQYEYNGSCAMLIVGDSANNLLCFIDNLDSVIHENGCFEKNVNIVNTRVEHIHAHVIHTTLVGVDTFKTLVLNKPAENTADKSKKPTTKRKRQTKLNISSIKKTKPNAVNNADENNNLNRSVLADNTSSLSLLHFKPNLVNSRQPDENYNAEVSAFTENSFNLSLQHFIFSKPKLRSTRNTCTASNANCTEVANTSTAIKSKSNSDDIKTDSLERKNSENSCKLADSSMLVQKRVTEYFTKKKLSSATPKDSGYKLDNEAKTIADSQEQLPNSCISMPETETIQLENAQPLAVFTDATAVCQIEEPIDLASDKNVENDLQHNSKTRNEAAETGAVVKSSVASTRSNYNCQNSSLHVPSKAFTLSSENANVLAVDLTVRSPLNNITNNATSNELRESHTMFQLFSQESVKEETFRLWYTVAMRFLKLKPETQNYANFKSIYNNLSANQSLQITTKPLRSVGVSPIKRKEQEIDKIRSSHNNTNNNTIKSNSMCSKASCSFNTTKNPFRLQLCKDEASQQLSRSRVNRINRSVMSVVFNMKCEDTHDTTCDTLDSMEKQLLLQQTQNDARELTFDDYCRLYLNTTLD